MLDQQTDITNEVFAWEQESQVILDMANTIHFNYVALQHGMDLTGVIDEDLRAQVTEHHFSTCSMEDLNTTLPAEQYRKFIITTPYAFALESFLESILEWSVLGQALFICFFPGGIIFWCIACLERIYRDSQALAEARKRLVNEGFYNPNANPADYAHEALDEKSLPKYQKTSTKAYPAKQLMEELEASYTLMRIFCDATNGGAQIKVRQLLPSLKKLGYEVDQNRGKIRRDPSKKPVKGTMQELGYGDPAFIKQIFVKTTPHTDLLPTFIKAMKYIQQEQKDQSGVIAKLQRFFHVGKREEIKPEDKIGALLIGEALKATLMETEACFRMSLSLMAVIHKFD